jgi:hypothetical protein
MFGNTLERWREILVHLEAPGSASDNSASAGDKSGSAGNKSGNTNNRPQRGGEKCKSTLNHIRAS